MERGTPPRSSGAKPRERGSGGGSRAAPAPLNRWAYRIEPPLAVRDLRHLDLNRHSRRRFEAEDVARRVVARSGRDTSVRRHGDDLRVSEPAHIGIDLARYPEVAILDEPTRRKRMLFCWRCLIARPSQRVRMAELDGEDDQP